ncbi:LOW QUALITY PROTEIN: junctophilin-2-like [Amphiura filiformis]|uniref:LOW QUALITY PROTEIN: junctophilin-2-like n=1 Tax=Amphiura filiformis TaxID=82378 RepID=UPI003B21D21F
MSGGGRFDFDDGGSYAGGWEEGRLTARCVHGPKCKGEYSGCWHYGFEMSGVYTWPSGNTFEGQWENGRRHGLGVESKGRWVYKGEWTQGYKGKYGVIQSLASGARYEGTWSSGLQDGYGQETYADGGIYQGQWTGGMRHGYGIRNSVPYGMASIVRPILHTSLTSLLKRKHENGSVSSTIPDNFGQRGGFALDVSGDETASDLDNKSAALKRGDANRGSKLMSLRGKRAKKDKNSPTSPTSASITHSAASLRHGLAHQDSIKSHDSTLSSTSLQSSVYESEMVHLHEEERTHDVTEVFMGEWKQDKRCGVGVSQRSDGFQYAGEWLQNKRHGYGCLTYPDGHREEGKWKHNMLVASGKKKLFVIGSKKIRDRVASAVEAANQAAHIARQKADLAVSRAAYAKEKGEMADLAASEAREDSIKARLRSKELTAALPPRGSEGDIKLDRKKSVFGRHMGSMDRKSRMRGTLVQVKPGEAHLAVPSSAHNDKPGTSNEWDGRGTTAPYDSSQMRQASSTGNLFEGSPVPRRRLRSPEQQSISSQHSRGYAAPHHDMGAVKTQRFEDDYSISDQGYYDDRRHPNWAPDKRYIERSSAELTPDSGISTTSDSIDRVRRGPPETRRGLGKRQLTRQEGMDDNVYPQNHHDPHHQHHDSRYDDYRQESVEEEEESTSFDVRYEEDESMNRRKQQQKKKSKFNEAPAKLDLPPGHYRTFQGRFPSRCGIKYLPKSTSRDEDWRDPDLDAEGALAIQSGRMSWAASRGLVFLVLILNLGFAVLFTNLFLQMEEEGEHGWSDWR